MGTTAEFAAIVRSHRETLLADWRAQVRALPSAQQLDAPVLDNHVLRLIDLVADALAQEQAHPSTQRLQWETSPMHGQQRLNVGFDIEEVVMELNILRDCLHKLAEDAGQPLQGEAFKIVNQQITAQVAASVRAYAAESKESLRKEQDRLLAFVAHDLRTPLNAISIALDVLEHKKADPALTERMMASLRRNVQRLKSLVNEVLEANVDNDLNSAARAHMRPLELRPMVQGCINELEPVARENGTTLVNLVPEPLIAQADPVQLARVFQNLISNAISHARSDRIAIGAEPTPGNRLTCSVQDDGVGLAQRAGRRAASEAGAHGLGLAIVKQLVEAHGGMLHVDSKSGKGTTFRFDLPMAAEGSRDLGLED